MATITSFTSIEQSRKLAEILPLESADMHYARAYFEGNEQDWFIGLGKPIKSDDIIPCWSLAALLDILPSGKVLIHDKSSHRYKCICKNIDTNLYGNPIDACYEMIIKLNELNLL